jgi:hypothetical protein
MFRTYIKTTETNRTVTKQTETNQNNPKFSEKHPNILSFKLFELVFCLFRFIRNMETLCFGIEAKQPKQTVLKQTEKNRNKRFVSDSAETTFGGFEWKLVLKDTLGFYMAF